MPSCARIRANMVHNASDDIDACSNIRGIQYSTTNTRAICLLILQTILTNPNAFQFLADYSTSSTRAGFAKPDNGDRHPPPPRPETLPFLLPSSIPFAPFSFLSSLFLLLFFLLSVTHNTHHRILSPRPPVPLPTVTVKGPESAVSEAKSSYQR